ncbi:MAG TPA: sugar nucleotide-binding protein [Patescibacteria group bacterium]|nr:sugar nucleotide-binding protein [Patescibacteria group bacterium]
MKSNLKRILVTGANGAVASDVVPVLLSRGYRVLATDIDCPSDSPFKLEYMDIRKPREIESVFRKFKPQCVIHLAAEVDVELCEIDEKHAMETNTQGTRNIADACKKHKAIMVFASSVGVFDGKKKKAYDETDIPRPINVYGKSKYEAEKYVQEELRKYFIVRFGWMMGGVEKDKKFVVKILKLIRKGVKTLDVVKDKKGTPVYTLDLAETIANLITTDDWGIYHIACLGTATRFDVAKQILLEIKRKDIKLNAVLTAGVNKIFFAPRPDNESVDTTKIRQKFPGILRDWKDALHDYLGTAAGFNISENEPKVTIIICLYIVNDRFFKDLRKFKKLKYKNFELIVVADKPVEIPKLGFPTRVVLTGKERTGVGEKRDAALSMAKGDIIAYIDDDAYPYPEWLANAVLDFKHPRVGAVGGPNITPNEDSFWAKIGGYIYESYLMSGGAQYRFIPTKKQTVNELQGVNLIIRKDILKKIGGFSTKLFSGDDTKVCYSIRLLGYDVLYDPDVKVHHHRREFPIKHLRQVRTMGTHRGYFVKEYTETSLHPIYFLPSLFAIFYFLLLILGFLNSTFFIFWILCNLVFLSLGVLSLYKRVGITNSVISSFGILITHLTYGFFFLKGLIFVDKL